MARALQLWNAFTLKTLASAPVRIPLGGPTPWYSLLLEFTPGNIMSGYVNGAKLITVSDLTLTGGGYPGLYATYSATFASLSVTAPCTLGTCSPTMVQGLCQFTCPTGYIASSNGTLLCNMAASGASAFWSGPSLTCTLPPPVFYGAYIVTPEALPVGSVVGPPLSATSTSPSSTVLFSIDAGNTNGAFWINSCSGYVYSG